MDYDSIQLRKWSKKDILKCPVCEAKVIYKNGKIKIPHFAHDKDSDCTYTYFENETKEHALGKMLLYMWIKSLPNVHKSKLECWIPETKQRPDIYFEIGKQKYVIEYQCSPMTVETFIDRDSLYKINGINSIWIFGLCKYNYNKLNSVQKYIFNNKEILYYFDSFNEMLYKNESFYGHIFKQDIKDNNNLFIDLNEIFLNQNIYLKFCSFMRIYKNKIYGIGSQYLSLDFQKYNSQIFDIKQGGI